MSNHHAAGQYEPRPNLRKQSRQPKPRVYAMAMDAMEIVHTHKSVFVGGISPWGPPTDTPAEHQAAH